MHFSRSAVSSRWRRCVPTAARCCWCRTIRSRSVRSRTMPSCFVTAPCAWPDRLPRSCWSTASSCTTMSAITTPPSVRSTCSMPGRPSRHSRTPTPTSTPWPNLPSTAVRPYWVCAVTSSPSATSTALSNTCGCWTRTATNVRTSFRANARSSRSPRDQHGTWTN
ncbi:hypothetical protein D3C75_811550 [compost metagenome]